MKFLMKLIRLFLPCAGFDAADMNRIHGGTVTLWAYKSLTDSLATMIADAYFDPHVDQLRTGDIIFISDLNVPTIDMVTITSATGAVPVTVLNGT